MRTVCIQPEWVGCSSLWHIDHCRLFNATTKMGWESGGVMTMQNSLILDLNETNRVQDTHDQYKHKRWKFKCLVE